MKYHVANFEIDTEQFQIICANDELAVEPKVFDLIVYLIENRQRLVTRDELFEQVWRGREVSDTTLSNHIKSARRILGDDGVQQQVIKTHRGRGYQFIAEVDIAKLSAEKQVVTSKNDAANSNNSQQRKAINKFAYIVLALFTLAFTY